MDGGRIIALDTPANLVRCLDAEMRVTFELEGCPTAGLRSTFEPAIVERVVGVTRVERDGERVVISGQGRRLVSGVVLALEAEDVAFQNLRTEQPNLEDVFLALTGRQMRD
jgi:ABC-2 type transport system ATP-binding protein